MTEREKEGERERERARERASERREGGRRGADPCGGPILDMKKEVKSVESELHFRAIPKLASRAMDG